MDQRVMQVAAEAFESTGAKRRAILLVDRCDDLAASLSERFPGAAVLTLGADVNIDPDDIWLASPSAFNLIVIANARGARDLYRVISLAARALAPGGLIFIPSHGSVKDRARFEACEVYVDICPKFQRILAQGDVSMLRRMA